MQSFLKWVGSKRKLASTIVELIPAHDTFHELFVGSGSVFFALQPKKAVLSDRCEELILCYQQVRDYPKRVIAQLQEMEAEFIACERGETGKEYYYSIRNLDRDRHSFNLLPKEYRAARFIFINRKGFNALWRTNQRGECNVPLGDNSNQICDRDTILRCSEALQGAKLYCQNFTDALSLVTKKDVMYLDPPYVPININSFVGYGSNGFDEVQHRLLALALSEFSYLGYRWILSNSDTQWVRDRYKQYQIIEVSRSGAINCKGDRRQKVKELLITNRSEKVG